MSVSASHGAPGRSRKSAAEGAADTLRARLTDALAGTGFITAGPALVAYLTPRSDASPAATASTATVTTVSAASARPRSLHSAAALAAAAPDGSGDAAIAAAARAAAAYHGAQLPASLYTALYTATTSAAPTSSTAAAATAPQWPVVARMRALLAAATESSRDYEADYSNNYAAAAGAGAAAAGAAAAGADYNEEIAQDAAQLRGDGSRLTVAAAAVVAAALPYAPQPAPSAKRAVGQTDASASVSVESTGLFALFPFVPNEPRAGASTIAFEVAEDETATTAAAATQAISQSRRAQPQPKAQSQTAAAGTAGSKAQTQLQPQIQKPLPRSQAQARTHTQTADVQKTQKTEKPEWVLPGTGGISSVTPSPPRSQLPSQPRTATATATATTKSAVMFDSESDASLGSDTDSELDTATTTSATTHAATSRAKRPAPAGSSGTQSPSSARPGGPAITTTTSNAPTQRRPPQPALSQSHHSAPKPSTAKPPANARLDSDGGGGAERPDRATRRAVRKEIYAGKQAVGAQLAAALAQRRAAEAARVKPECKFFAQGGCRAGASCPFSHTSKSAAAAATSATTAGAGAGGETTVPVVPVTVCAHHLRGACTRGAQCGYSHDLSRVPCRHYHNLSAAPLGAATNAHSSSHAHPHATVGSCRNGDKCPFSHAPLTAAARAELEAAARARVTARAAEAGMDGEQRAAYRRGNKAAEGARAAADGLIASLGLAAGANSFPTLGNASQTGTVDADAAVAAVVAAAAAYRDDESMWVATAEPTSAAAVTAAAVGASQSQTEAQTAPAQGSDAIEAAFGCAEGYGDYYNDD